MKDAVRRRVDPLVIKLEPYGGIKQMIKENEGITIERVGNGFMIIPGCRGDGMAQSVDDTMVFNTISQLTKFIKEHFVEKERVL